MRGPRVKKKKKKKGFVIRNVLNRSNLISRRDELPSLVGISKVVTRCVENTKDLVAVHGSRGKMRSWWRWREGS